MTTHATRSADRSRRDVGQAVLEVALALPLLVTALLGAAQVIAVAVHRTTLVHVTRDAVRAASVSADPVTAARGATARGLPTAVSDTTVYDGVVTVVVTDHDPTDVPIIGALLPGLTLTAEASMMLEPGP